LFAGIGAVDWCANGDGLSQMLFGLWHTVG
jgi:hypothetical protein